MLFSGVSLSFVDIVGHILSFNNSDMADILCKTRDLVRKANLMLHTFSAADPSVKSSLLKLYCLSLYDCYPARYTYVQAGLSNWFCLSAVVVVVVLCHKKLQTGDLEAATISKQEINAEVCDTLACLYLI